MSTSRQKQSLASTPEKDILAQGEDAFNKSDYASAITFFQKSGISPEMGDFLHAKITLALAISANSNFKNKNDVQKSADLIIDALSKTKKEVEDHLEVFGALFTLLSSIESSNNGSFDGTGALVKIITGAFEKAAKSLNSSEYNLTKNPARRNEDIHALLSDWSTLMEHASPYVAKIVSEGSESEFPIFKAFSKRFPDYALFGQFFNYEVIFPLNKMLYYEFDSALKKEYLSLGKDKFSLEDARQKFGVPESLVWPEGDFKIQNQT